MCQFLSALVTKDGQVLHASEYTDSHEVLVRYFGYAKNDQQLNDDRRLFVRVEFTPPGDLSTVVDIKKWRFLLDESVAPAWFNKSIEDLVKTKLRNIVKKMLIGGDQDVILGGCYILHGKARISCFYGGVVKLMSGSSQVNEMCNSSQVKLMSGSSQVKLMSGSSQVNRMRGSSQVNEMWGSSQVKEMSGSSQVNEMCNSSQVNKMWDLSQVNWMCNSSQVNEMCNSSQVKLMSGSSRVNEMCNSSQVNKMCDSSQVNKMWDSSKIITNNSSKK